MNEILLDANIVLKVVSAQRNNALDENAKLVALLGEKEKRIQELEAQIKTGNEENG